VEEEKPISHKVISSSPHYLITPHFNSI